MALAERLGLHPVITVGEGDEAVGLIANPITFSDAEIRYRRRPPGLGEDSDEIRGVAREPTPTCGRRRPTTRSDP